MIKNKKFRYDGKDYLILDLPHTTNEISCGLHCIGIKPPLDASQGGIDSNGWFHAYTEMFHGYKKLENQAILDDLVDKYFLRYNHYVKPDENDDSINIDYYCVLLNDYYYGESITFENPVIFIKDGKEVNN